MKTGIVLPTFRDDPSLARDVARQAAALGVDGVFAYDHLWPMGNPERPAIAPFPFLASIAHEHPDLWVGPLVARIGLASDDVLVRQFATLKTVANGRVIAAVGTGDRLSQAENVAYGIPFASADVRREHLGFCVERLQTMGLATWIGGGASATLALAASLTCPVNLWSASPEALRSQGEVTPVTWAGALSQCDPKIDPSDHEAVRRLLGALDDAGAQWAVLGWPAPLDVLGECSTG